MKMENFILVTGYILCFALIICVILIKQKTIIARKNTNNFDISNVMLLNTNVNLAVYTKKSRFLPEQGEIIAHWPYQQVVIKELKI